MTTAAISADLHAAIGEGLQLFQQVDETRTTARPREGAWCAREIVGHLIDSAANNHRRFVLGQLGTAAFDGYDQDAWVATQAYAKVPWRDLVALWSAYNRHLAHVIGCTSDDAASRTALAADGSKPVSVAFLMEDYVRHLRHHMAQVRRLLVP